MVQTSLAQPPTQLTAVRRQEINAFRRTVEKIFQDRPLLRQGTSLGCEARQGPDSDEREFISSGIAPWSQLGFWIIVLQAEPFQTFNSPCLCVTPSFSLSFCLFLHLRPLLCSTPKSSLCPCSKFSSFPSSCSRPQNLTLCLSAQQDAAAKCAWAGPGLCGGLAMASSAAWSSFLDFGQNSCLDLLIL